MTPRDADRPPRQAADPKLQRECDLSRNRTGLTDELPTVRTMWRVRWRRPGWVRPDRKVRYFSEERYARFFADRLAGSWETDAGPIVFDVARCEATAWVVVDDGL